jgi:hypothetical protein
MTMKPTKPRAESIFPGSDEPGDVELERNLAARHAEIEGKLQAAKASIARGEAAPLEPLDVLLRDARRQAKSPR